MGWQDAPEVSANPAWMNAPEVGADSTAKEPKKGTLANIGIGALKGASDIGRTILTPLDRLGITGMTSDERKAALARFFEDNADPNSIAFKGGELGSQIAGTAGAGGVLAKGVSLIPSLARFAPALESGGLTLGSGATNSALANTAIRSGAGAVTGATMAGMVNPDDAGTGAVIGAALPPAVQAAGKVGNAVSSTAKKVLGATTGVGDEAINAALQAGKDGNAAFLDNMRGNVPMQDVLDQAKTALSNMRSNRAAEYRSGMAGVSADQTVLDMQPIMDAVKNVQSMGTYKGQVLNKNAAGTVDEVANAVSDWAKLNPADYHTPEGLDALKKAIGDIRETTQPHTQARLAVDRVYNAVKDQITAQAPAYAKTMKGYEEASKLISEIERALSLGNKASADTSMRKLQSLMRNNVNTNYGNRLDLARQLGEQGGEDIIPAVAGQAMNGWMPRGLAKLGQAGTGIAALAGHPWMAASLPFTSPRLMGEMLYKSGQVAGKTDGAMTAAVNSVASNPRLAAMAQALRDARYPMMTAVPMALASHE